MSSANPVLDFATGIAGFDPSMISTARPNEGGHVSPFYLATSDYALRTAIASRVRLVVNTTDEDWNF